MKIPSLTFLMIGVQTAAGLLIPAVLGLYSRKKLGCRPLPFFTGCLVFLAFAVVLEGTVHSLVLSGAAGDRILGTPWLYAVYGGLMAGLFEEGGRYLAFRTVLHKSQAEDKNALAYGAGHGGFECFHLLALTGVTNLVYAVLINSGREALVTAQLPEASLAQWDTLVIQLSQSTPWIYLLGIVERVGAVVLQLSFSVLVWFAAKDGVRKTGLLPLAILLHAAVDAAAVLAARVLPAAAVELLLLLIAAAAALLARSVWKRFAARPTTE